MYKLSKYILFSAHRDLIESHRYAWKIAMCHLYAERWSSNNSISETQKHPQAHGMVSIIFRYLGYWTKSVDTALQGVFCNKPEILLPEFRQAWPDPVPQIIPFLRQAQTHHPTAMAATRMLWDARWNERHSHLLLWNQRKPTVLNGVRDVLRLSTRFTQSYPQKAENFIIPKQRSWKREIPRILTPRLQWALYKLLSSCWD